MGGKVFYQVVAGEGSTSFYDPPTYATHRRAVRAAENYSREAQGLTKLPDVKATKPSQAHAVSKPSTLPANGLTQWSWSTLTVPLIIHSPDHLLGQQPATVGVPFPRGALTGVETLVLSNADDARIALQVLPLARWSDGCVKWLLLDFVLPSANEGTASWMLRRCIGDGPRLSPVQGLSVAEHPHGIVVETGVVKFHLNRTILQPLAQVLWQGQPLLKSSANRVLLTNPKGETGIPRVDRVVVEARGPVRATVRLEGTFTGRVRARFTARCCFFAGTGLVRVRLTLHNPNRARHRGGLWDLGDPGSMLFQDLSMELGLEGSGSPRITWTPEVGRVPRTEEAGELEIYQDSSGGENWTSKNHVNRFGRVPCAFRGYRTRVGGQKGGGLRASPVVALHGPAGAITAAVPEFWQQFPKAIEVEDRVLRVRLFPRQASDLFELQGGERKTHTVWLHFGSPNLTAGLPLAWVHQPVSVRSEPEWYTASEAVPYLTPAPADASNRLDSLLAEAVDGPVSFFARREIIDEYGWRNYGEIYADHETAYYIGPSPVISHYNNQYDFVLGTLLQFLRTGDPRWYELLDPLARHVIDIDIYHTTRDRPAYNGGMFWFTDHYKDAATCTHRTYSATNRRPGERSYGGGPGSSHNFTTGLLNYYFLTGNPDAREAVTGLADWVISMDDGAQTALGLLDPGPTGLASFTGTPDYHGPGRGCGNSINALLDGWAASGERKNLDKAEVLIRRSIHPGDDIVGLELLNVEKRWSYSVFLSAVARYLEIKEEAGQLDFAHAYARASLLAYAVWMLENEVPYFDQCDKLEYPTETWAAQELRKANVLRLAAMRADDLTRSRLLRRADELGDRGWADLFRFEMRTTARALAILMVEGSKEDFLKRELPTGSPVSRERFDFGKPAQFVPQKQRVLAQLKRVRGFTWLIIRLGNIRNWQQSVFRPRS
jgi:hypothetical protein